MAISQLLDGQDIRQANVKYLREQMGLVSQEPVLFDYSIEGETRLDKSWNYMILSTPLFSLLSS